jgi:hypothetical protein
MRQSTLDLAGASEHYRSASKAVTQNGRIGPIGCFAAERRQKSARIRGALPLPHRESGSELTTSEK